MLRSRPIYIILVLVFSFLLGADRASLAEDTALEKLLGIFEKRGFITPTEVRMVRETMAQDRERLLKKEKEIAEKERALFQKEEELQEKEKTLQIREQGLSQGIKMVPEKVSPVQGTSAGEGPAGGKVASPQPEEAQGALPLKAAYQDGLSLSAADPQTFSLYLGALLQADYRYFDYDNGDPNKNKFDLRRVRLLIGGHLLKHFDYKFEYEFQGAEARNLLDAYVDTKVCPFVSLRIGQFKEPFSLEQYTKDKDIFFAERSMGYYLTPQRDLGLMAHASLWSDRINYGVGIFNGDGRDDSAGGDEDAPQLTGRVVFSPFKDRGMDLVEHLQVGGSLTYAKIDQANVQVLAKTTGLTPFFDVASMAKFNIIRDVETSTRYGAELGWAYGPLALMGEYIRLEFKDVTTSSNRFDTELEDYYVALLWMITGDEPVFRNGVFQPLKPRRSLWEGGWGGVGLAFRYDAFRADDRAYDNLINAGDSVREADAYTIALNWYLNAYVQLILDATRTTFDRPLLIDRDPLTGATVFSDREDVVTGRFQFQY